MGEKKLTRGHIVIEALELLQSGGLREVSLRKIAARLDVKAMSLYWHVESKEALYVLMSREIFQRCLQAIPPCHDWQEWLREFGLSLWAAQQRTPDIRQLITITPVDAETREVNRRTIPMIVTQLGLDPSLAVAAQGSVQALVTGWTTLQMRPSKPRQSAEYEFLQSLDALIEGWAARARDSRSKSPVPSAETLL
jgi:TetR/AcrR family tetracycline transcriptional repressor